MPWHHSARPWAGEAGRQGGRDGCKLEGWGVQGCLFVSFGVMAMTYQSTKSLAD